MILSDLFHAILEGTMAGFQAFPLGWEEGHTVLVGSSGGTAVRSFNPHEVTPFFIGAPRPLVRGP